MKISGGSEETYLQDPCLDCDRLKDRDLFFVKQAYGLNLSLNESQDGQPHGEITQHLMGQQKYQHLFEAAPDAIFVADIKIGIILEANKKAAELLGIPLDQVKGMHQSQLHPPEEIEKYKQIFQEHIQKGSAEITEDIYVVNKDGENIPVQINASVGMFGARKAIYGIFRDRTEYAIIQQQLTDSECMYRELYNHAFVPLYRARLSDGKLLECNDAMAILLGYASKEDLMQADFYSAKHYVNQGLRKELLRQIQDKGYVQGFEVEITRRDGTHAWVEITARLNLKKNWLEGTLKDITAAKLLSKAERKVLDIIMQGKSNKEIARELDRSIRTIEDHRSQIMQKLGVDNLVDLTQKVLNFLSFHQEK